jgi:hypothetical protein
VGLAKATKDPKISAALLEKAADLKLQVDGPGMLGDLTPLAPDMEPPKARRCLIGSLFLLFVVSARPSGMAAADAVVEVTPKKRPQPGAGWGRSSQYVMCRTAGNGTATQFPAVPNCSPAQAAFFPGRWVTPGCQSAQTKRPSGLVRLGRGPPPSAAPFGRSTGRPGHHRTMEHSIQTQLAL